MKKKSLKVNAMLNGLKQLCTLLFPLISFPYVSRVLGTESYGMVNFGQSFVSYFSLIAALGISNYAIREGAHIKNDRLKLNQFATEVFSINMISTLVSYIFMFIIVLNISSLESYRLLITIQSTVIIFSTLGMDWVNNIFEDFAYLTIRYIVFQVLAICAMFLFIHGNDNYIAYAIILVGASTGANILNFFRIRKYISFGFTLKCQYKKHLIPMLILFFNGLAVTIYVNSDTTIVGFICGDYAVGLYSVSVKIYTIIKQLFNALVIVAVPRLSFLLGDKRIKEYNELVNKVINLLLCFILPSMCGLFIMAKEIIQFISGKEYIMATSSLKILSISLVFAVFACFFSNCILVPNRLEKYFLKSTLTGAVVNIGLNLVVIPLWGIDGAAITTLVSEMISFYMICYYSRDCYEIKIKLRDICSIIVGVVCVIFVCLLIGFLIENWVVKLMLSIVCSILLYLGVLVIMGNSFFIGCLKDTYRKIRS